MVTIERIRALIHVLDPRTDQCPVIVRRSSWANVETNSSIASRLNSSLYGVDPMVLIDRERVFRARNSERFLQLVLLWGFPTGMHGIGASAFANWNQLLTLYQYLREHNHLTNTQYLENVIPMFNQIHGVSLAFFSKLLYFMNVTISGAPAVINDTFVREGIGKVLGPEIIHLNNVAKYKYRLYPDFLCEMQNLANQLGSTPERLEYVFWLIGKKEI